MVAPKTSRTARQPAASPLRRENLMTEIENDIISGRLAIGARVDERELCERFGVSRTPVREVLAALTASGLLESRPHQGVFVAQMTLGQVFETSEVMAELESMCARLSARRMLEPQRRHLLELAGAGAEDPRPETYAARNLSFHEAIYRGSRNAALERTTLQLRRQLEPFRRFALMLPGSVERSVKEHQAIAEAVAEGDAERAGELARAHIDLHRPEFADYVLHLNSVLGGGRHG